MPKTLEEIRKLWCPYARFTTETVRQPTGGEIDGSRCRAPECVMWEFKSGSDTEGDCGLKG